MIGGCPATTVPGGIGFLGTIIGLITRGVDRLLVALSPTRSARRDAAQQVILELWS